VKSLILAAFFGLFSTGAWAAVDKSASGRAPSMRTRAINSPRPGEDAKVFGEIQLRPSWQSSNNTFHTENILNLGYKFTPRFNMDYVQYFNTNLADPSYQSAVVGDDGFLRARLSKIYESRQQDITLDYETRVYMPTNPARRAAGMITAWRNYATFTKKFSPTFSLITQVIPIVYAFEVSGRNGAANPVFDSRLYIIASWDITSKINFEFPLMVWATRYQRHAIGAVHNDLWGYTAVIWPTVMYSFSPKTQVGVSYYSGSLIKDDLSSGSIFGADGGLTQGVTQLVFRQTL